MVGPLVLIQQIFVTVYIVTPAHAVTSIKQSSVLKGHLFHVLS